MRTAGAAGAGLLLMRQPIHGTNLISKQFLFLWPFSFREYFYVLLGQAEENNLKEYIACTFILSEAPICYINNES